MPRSLKPLQHQIKKFETKHTLIQELIMKNKSKYIGMALVIAAALSTTACNTIQGAGEDLASTGKAIEKAAE